MRTNSTAERMFDAHSSVRNRRLSARERLDNNRLRASIASVTGASHQQNAPAPDAVAIARAHRRPLLVQAAPLVHSACDFFRQARALVVLLDLAAHTEPDPLFLAAAFDLTPR